MKPPIRWPRAVKSTVFLSFDLDAETAWISRDPANINRLSVMSQGAYGPKVGVPLILDFLDANRLKVTFFIPGWTAERYPDVVAEIHRRGHEIGHHGYLHEGLEGRSRDEEEAILVKSSKILADITGTPPVTGWGTFSMGQGSHSTCPNMRQISGRARFMPLPITVPTL